MWQEQARPCGALDRGPPCRLSILRNANIAYSPRDEALLITRQRPKGLKVVSYPKFSIDSENPFLGGQSLRVLGEK